MIDCKVSRCKYAHRASENDLRKLSTPRNDVDQDHDNRNYQQDVNKPSHGVTAHKSRQPQNYQDYSNGPQHIILLSLHFADFQAIYLPIPIYLPIRIVEMSPITPKTLNSQIITTIITTTLRIFLMVDCIGM
jgi:hypothetical protein